MPIVLPQFRLVGSIIAGLCEHFEVAVRVDDPDGGMRHPVEEGGLHHRVMDHVVEDDAVADFQGLGEGEVAHADEEDVKEIRVIPSFNQGGQETVVHVLLKSNLSQETIASVNELVEELPQKMSLRSTGFSSFVVKVEHC